MGAAAGAELGRQLGFPILGTAGGAAAAMIKFDLGLRPRLAVSPTTAAFAYVYEANRKFGLR